VKPEHEELLRRLALNDPRAVEAVLGSILQDPGQASSRAKVQALLRLAALIAADAAPTSYQWAVEAAMSAGASEADVADVVVAVGPIVGQARLTSAARQVAQALGYDDETTSPE
jgi:hypothetical protein